MSDETFDSQIELAIKSIEEQKNIRDESNSKTAEFIAERNQCNSDVRELIAKVQKNKKIRDKANLEVKTNKQVRATKNQKVKEAKKKLREFEPQGTNRNRRGRRDKEDTPASLRRKIENLEADLKTGKITGQNENTSIQQLAELRRKLRKFTENEDSNVELKEARENLRQAIDEQEVAHQAVTNAADNAQEAHDLMITLSDEVDRLREKADASQSNVRRVKREADRAHQKYIVGLRVLNSMKDINRARETIGDVVEPLSSKQIETAKEFIIDYYENEIRFTSNHDMIRHSEFIEFIEYELVPDAHKMKIFTRKVGPLVGRKGVFVNLLQQKLCEQFPSLRIEIKEIKNSKEHSSTSNPKGPTQDNIGEEE